MAVVRAAREAGFLYIRCGHHWLAGGLEQDLCGAITFDLTWEELATERAVIGTADDVAEGLARYVGITSHTDPETLAEALRRYDVDCTQMALNAALQGMQSGPGKMVINPVRSTSFEKVALLVANKKNLGVIAMKVFAQDHIISEDSPPSKLLRYALSLPVSVVTVGVPKHEYLQANLAAARSFTPMPPKEMKEFSHRMSARHKIALDRRFSDHLDV